MSSTSQPRLPQLRTSPIRYLTDAVVEPASDEAVLRAEGMARTFGHVRALRGADLLVNPGEVVGLVGDNGAGKSTLVKTLTGSVRRDHGRIEISGQPVEIDSPARARALGIEVVHQDLALADDLSVVANLFLGRELIVPGQRWRNALDQGKMAREAGDLLKLAGIRLPSLRGSVRGLSGGQRQIIAVLRALAFVEKLVFMDEPTAALGVTQTELVTQLIRQAASEGVAVVLISHNLPELIAVADRIVVMRLGRSVATFDAKDVTNQELIAAMTGLTK